VKVEAWITDDFARELFAAAGQDFDALKERARTADFEPVPLGATATSTWAWSGDRSGRRT
jgi:hypothetical protein